MELGVQIASGSLGRSALEEWMNIGSGHALTALSRLLADRPFNMGVPDLAIGSDALLLPALDATGVVVGVNIDGDWSGSFLIALEQSAAVDIARQMLRGPGQNAHLTVLEESALLELANISACAFMDAVNRLTGQKALPTPPMQARGHLGTGLRDLARLDSSDPVLVTRFQSRSGVLAGHFCMRVSGESTRKLLKSLGSA